MKHKFGERLRQLRKEKNISAEQLAEMMRINKSTSCAKHLIASLETYLNISLIDFLDKKNEYILFPLVYLKGKVVLFFVQNSYFKFRQDWHKP